MVNNFNNFLKQLRRNLLTNDITEYEITEHFDINGDRTYKVNNLNYEIEFDMIYFKDEEEKLMYINYVLRNFILQSLTAIDFTKDLTKLYFESGYITIKTID